MYTNVTDSFKEVVKSNIITTTARLTFKNFFSNHYTVKDVNEATVETINNILVNSLSTNVDLVFTKEDISQNGLKIEDDCCYDGQIIGTAMSKEVEIEILNLNNYDLADKVFDLEIGVLTDREKGTYEFIPYGQYVVVSYEDLKSSNKYKIIANDLMIKLNEPFEQNKRFVPTFPIKLKDKMSLLFGRDLLPEL